MVSLFRRAALSVAVLVASALPGASWAWGPTGHRTTGAIADHYLTPKARAEITAILGPETLAEASTWPDFMRSDPAELWQKTANPWHYVTVPKGKLYKDVGAPPEGDSITALARFKATLRDPKASLADKQLALRFIIHIVGDLQMPLHVGNGTDRGGNDRKVKFFGVDTNLHAVWDYGIIDRELLSFTEWADWLNAALTPQQLRDWSSSDPQTWLADSATIRDTIYPAEDEISFKYVYANLPIIRQQLQKGGLRVAAYLNDVFAPTTGSAPAAAKP